MFGLLITYLLKKLLLPINCNLFLSLYLNMLLLEQFKWVTVGGQSSNELTPLVVETKLLLEQYKWVTVKWQLIISFKDLIPLTIKLVPLLE